MSSGLGILNRSLLGLFHIVLLALLLGSGVAHAQSESPNTEIQFQNFFYDGDEDGEVQVVLERVRVSGGGSPDDASAVVQFLAGSASSNDIRFFNPTTVNWSSGDEATKVINITLLDDFDLEGTENFILEIVQVNGDAVLGSMASAEIEIRDQYPGKLVYVGEPFDIVEDAVDNFVDVMVERVGGSAGQVNVTIGNRDDTATFGTDYKRVGSRQLNWNDGETGIRTVRYRAIPDTLTEPDETFDIGDVDGFRNIGPGSSTVTIIDGSPPVNAGVVDFVDSVYTLNETDGSIDLRLRRSAGIDDDVSVTINLLDVTATYPDDGTFSSGSNVQTISWLDGDDADKTVTFFVEQDTVFPEIQERFDAALGSPTGGLAIGTSNPAASIFIDDSAPPFNPGVLSFVSDYTVSESMLTVRVEMTRSGGSDGTVTAILATGDSGDSAEPGNDYIDISTTGDRLTWDDGDTESKFLDIQVLMDTEVEPDETFTVTLLDTLGGAGFGIETSVITISDTPPPADGVRFVLANDSIAEDGDLLDIELERVGTGVGSIQVFYEVISGTATRNTDFSDSLGGGSGEINWASGDLTNKTIPIDIFEDLLDEGDEAFTVELSISSGAGNVSLGVPNLTTITIVDVLPTMHGIIAFDPDFYTVDEAGDQLTLTVTRTMGSAGDVSVDFDVFSGTSPGEATEGADFTLSDPTNQTLSWEDGDSTPRSITFDIIDDTLFEDTESFSAQLSNLTGGAMFDGSSDFALVDITDNDPAPSNGTLAFVSDYTVSESMLSISVEVVRTGGSSGRVTASYSLGGSGDSAALGQDYGVIVEQAGELVWEDNDSASKFIEIDIALDTLVESDEQFTVAIVDTTGTVGVGDAVSVITITDTPPPADVVRFVTATDSIAEDGDMLSIELQRSGSGIGGVTVFYRLVSGTATLGSDFDYGSGCGECSVESVFWPSGDLSSKIIDVDIFEDLLIEGDETFTVELSLGTSPGNVSLGTPNTAAITIIDVPPPMPGVLQFDPDVYTVSELNGSVTLSVTRTGGSDGPASILFSVLSGTATTGEDHGVTEPISGTLDWPAGVADPRFITVDIATDALIETVEDFSVSLSSESGAAAGSALTASISISDSTMSDTIVLTDADVSVAEDAGVLALTVQRVGSGAQAVSALYSIVSGDADAGVDFGSILPLSGTVSWTAGDTTEKTIEIDITPDSLIEGDEIFEVSIIEDTSSNPVIIGTPSETTVTINDVAPPMPGVLQFDPDVYTVAESDGLVELIVTRTAGADGAASAAFEVIGGTAELGSDIAVTEPVFGTLDWLAGDSTSRTITVDVANDALVEESEEFTVLLTAITGSGPGSATTAIVTLMDSTDPTPDTVVFADDTIDVNEDAGLVSLVVQRVGTGIEAVSVSYAITDESALAGADYGASEPLTGTVIWAAGDTADKSIAIDVLSDDLVEANESFQVTLGPDASSVPVLIGSPDTIAVTIIDTTIPPLPDVIALVDASQSRLESEPMFELVITRTGNGIGESSVDWVLSPGSASLSDDINLDAITGTVSWADGQTGSQIVEIPIVNDGLDETDETLTLSLVNVQGASLGTPASSQLTIIDDDEPPVPGSIQFTVASINVNEDAGTVSLTVTRTAGSDGSITVVASTVPGSAGAEDFSAIQTMLSWDDGDTSNRELVVPIAFDTSTESTESFSVILSGATPDDGVLGSPMTVTVNINDVFNGSPGTVQFASGTASVDETDETLTVTVTRVGGTDGAIGVNYSTSANSATAGDDFDNTSGTLTWADGDGAPKTFTIAIATDTVAEAAEQFSVTLTNATPVEVAAIGTPGTLIVTINNVDPPPEPEPAPMPGTVQFTSNAISVNESAGTVSVSVARSGGNDGAVSVRYDTVADSAVEGDDYQPATGRLQWADGEDDVKVLSIAVSVDDIIENDELFRVVLSDGQPVEAILGTTSSIEVTIVDDSIAPPGVLAFVNATLSVAESDEVVELQVARTGGSAGAVSIGFTTVESSADSTDFAPTSGRLDWADGDTGIRTIRVPVSRDVLVEAIEQFQVVLADAQPLGDADQLGVSLATVSISDSTRLGTIGFLATELSVSERDRSITLSVTRSGGSDGDVSVDYAMIGSSAELGSDLVDQTGTLSWPDGDVESRSITILINVDNLVEGDEQFVVALSNAQPLGGQQLGEAQATITIIDATLLVDDITTPPIAALGALDLVVVSGDGQSGLPGDLLDPLVIDVVDRDAADATVGGVPIRWRAVPEGSAELLGGGRSVSDEAGRSSNRVRILSRGFLNIVATIDVAPSAGNGITTRIRAPDFPVGQGEAVFTVRSGLFAADGLRPNQAAIGAALDAACEVLGVRIEQQQVMTVGEQDLFDTCQEVEARLANDDGLAAALDRLLPEELFSIGDSIIDTTDIQVTNVYSRINAIRGGQVETVDVSGLQYRHYDQSIPGSVINAAQNELSGGGAAADGALGSSRLGFFANGSVSYGKVDGGENQSNADVETTGLTIGVDYRATDNTVFGAGLGIIKNTTEFNPDAGKAEVSGLNLTIFGTYYRHQSGYIDAVLDVGRNSYDITRRINLPNTPDQFGIGDTTADVLSFTVGAGRDFTRGAWEYGPYGRFSYIDADVDGYSENAAGSTEGFGSVLNIRAHSVRSTRLAIGGQLARTISTSRAVFIPQLRVEAEFEQEDKKEGIQATFQHDPTQTPFTVNGEDRDTSYVNLGIGSSAFFRNGRSGFLFYETQLGNDRVTQHFLKLGIRLEF